MVCVIPDQAKMEQDAPALYYKDDGVLVMNVYDFLLNEGSQDNGLMKKSKNLT